MGLKLILATLTTSSLILNTSLYSQDKCFNSNEAGKRFALGRERDIKYRITAGLCYHYYSTALEVGYKNSLLTLITMTPSPITGTPRMKEEIYFGYTYNLAIGKKKNYNIGITPAFEITTHKPVVRLYVDKRIYKGVFLHGSTIQVGTGMNHLIGGLKLDI